MNFLGLPISYLTIMNFRFIILLIFSITYSFTVYGQDIDIKEVEKFFKEYEEICHYDNGHLWGISLHGPLMFVEKESRTIIANTADKNGELKKINDVFYGILPDSQGIANTTIHWNGLQWTMVMWPLSDNKFERNQLIFHECFHSTQVKFGINLSNTENPHLETKEGRTWLQLEWLALLKALNCPNNIESIRDALIFRNYRRSLFPNSDSTENTLELLEGIPEYTGIKLSGRDSVETMEYFDEMIRTARDRASFYRTFPYTSGPLYCFLIEQKDIDWRKNLLDIEDLGKYLKNIYSTNIPDDLKSEVEKRSTKYDVDRIIELENLREEKILVEKDKIISTFIHGHTLSLPIRKPNIEFSPLNMMAIDDKGIYYKTLRLVDVWGILDVEDGAFITHNWSTVYVPANEMKQDSTNITGIGWNLKLNEGWELISEVGKKVVLIIEKSK